MPMGRRETFAASVVTGIVVLGGVGGWMASQQQAKPNKLESSVLEPRPASSVPAPEPTEFEAKGTANTPGPKGMKTRNPRQA